MTSCVTDTEPIRAIDTINHVGERKTVYGTIASTYYSYESCGSSTFLNFDRPYPEQTFTIVIWGPDRSKFQESPEIMFEGKTVYVTGEISSYKGKPQIIVTDPSQIEISQK